MISLCLQAKQLALKWLDQSIREEVLQLAIELMKIPSISGNEQALIDYLDQFFQGLGWDVERISIPDSDRSNLFVSFGKPRIVFTTHCDVVPGPSHLFDPKIENGDLIGRGAVDVKGALSAMIAAAHNLCLLGVTDFGLLVVVGEEVDGIGATVSGRALNNRGIDYFINAEPTDGKLALGHPGAIVAELHFEGTSCHSGYPELGRDANEAAVKTAASLLAADFGSDPILGEPVRNIGILKGGIAPNLVSPSASFTFLIRPVHDDLNSVIQTIRSLSSEASEVRIVRTMKPGRMITVPGFETCVVKFGTDIPHLLEHVSAGAVLYGPGTIHRAHTDFECIAISELIESVAGYEMICSELKK